MVTMTVTLALLMGWRSVFSLQVNVAFSGYSTTNVTCTECMSYGFGAGIWCRLNQHTPQQVWVDVGALLPHCIFDS